LQILNRFVGELINFYLTLPSFSSSFITPFKENSAVIVYSPSFNAFRKATTLISVSTHEVNGCIL